MSRRGNVRRTTAEDVASTAAAMTASASERASPLIDWHGIAPDSCSRGGSADAASAFRARNDRTIAAGRAPGRTRARFTDFGPPDGPPRSVPLYQRDRELFQAVSKTVTGRQVPRGFESLPLRLRSRIPFCERIAFAFPHSLGRPLAAPRRPAKALDFAFRSPGVPPRRRMARLWTWLWSRRSRAPTFRLYRSSRISAARYPSHEMVGVTA